MNPDYPQPPETASQSQGARKKRGGCAGCLMIILAILLFGYILIFQTSIALKLIANSIEKSTTIDGRRIEISGVGGSLSRGIKIKRLLILGEHGDNTITDLKFRYKKPLRWFTRHQFTITELSSGSADFVVANDFFKSDEASEDPQDEVTKEEKARSSGEGFFELHLLNFKNTRIRTIDGLVDVNIPLIHMKGLHADSEGVRIEDFKIDSDVLSGSLTKGRTVEIEGSKVTFDQKIDMVIKPGIHASVIKDIPVSYEFGKAKGPATSRIMAFDGALQQVEFGDERSLVRFVSLKPLEYLKIDDQVMPAELSLTARQKGDLVTLEPGSFIIGQTSFHYEGRELHKDEEEALIGITNAGPYEVTATIYPKKSNKAWPPIMVELSSKPEAATNEILAQLYHGKDYASLTREEKAAIDKLQ